MREIFLEKMQSKLFFIALCFHPFLYLSAVEIISDQDIHELAYLNDSVDPCDDFYQFTCGNFGKIHQIQNGASYVDHFSLLEDQLMHLGNYILSSNKTTEDPESVKKVKTAYQSCVQTKVFDRQNRELPELQFIKEWNGMPLVSNQTSTNFSWNELGKMSAQFGIPFVFTLTPYPDFDNTEGFFVVLTQDELNNPSLIRPNFGKTYDQILTESFYEYHQKSARSSKLGSSTPKPFDIFLMTVSKLLVEASGSQKTDEEIQNDLDKMATFMRQLAKGGIVEDDAVIEAFPSSYPTLEELQQWTELHFGNTTNLNWVEYFNSIFSTAGVNATKDMKTYPYSPKFMYGVLNLVRQTDPEVVKNFAMFRVLLFLAPDSVGPMRQAFENYYRAKNYRLYPRWEYCTRKILDATDTASVSFAATYAYQEYYFNKNKLYQATDLVKNITNSFKETLKNADWMDETSKEAALTKVEKMLVLLAYPDFVEEKDKLDQFYRNIRICSWDNYGNAQRIRALKQAYIFSQLGHPRTRTFWDKSPFDTNAYYNRGNNRIILPIAMLNMIYFGSNSLVDYSRLGSIIGHEITHGFDAKGQLYNQDGVQIPWWSNETSEAFQELTQCFIEQYNQYYIDEIDAYVNGTTSLNENLADNGGIRQAYKAFKALTQQQSVAIKSNYTLDQLFFIGYGTSWCSNATTTYLMNYKNSEYSPNKYRVNGPVSNMVEFTEAFQCPKGSKMNPEKRCTLW